MGKKGVFNYGVVIYFLEKREVEISKSGYNHDDINSAVNLAIVI